MSKKDNKFYISEEWATFIIMTVIAALIFVLIVAAVDNGYIKIEHRPYHVSGFDSQGNTYYEYDD